MTTQPGEGLKIGVIGLGSVGLRHAENFLALGCKISGHDRDEARAELLDRWPAADFRPSLDDLIEIADACVIATPPASHIEQAAAAVAAGKHVLVEKPLSNQLTGVSELIETAGAKGVVAGVGYNLRYLPAFEKARKLVSSDAIGRLLTGRVDFGYHLAKWRPGVRYQETYSASASEGGVVLDAIHELDYLTWMCGPALAVTAVTARSGHLDIESEDIAEAVIELASGALIGLHLDYISAEYRRGFRFEGTEGSISWDWNRGSVRFARGEAQVDLPFKTDIDETYRAEARAFIDAVKGGATPVATLAEGRDSLELALALKESAAEGVRVHLRDEGKE